MKKNAILLAVLVVMLVGCSTQTSQQETDKKVENVQMVEGSGLEGKADKVDQIDSEEIENEQELLKDYFHEMISAVDENKVEKFLAYIDSSDELFYKEQQGWIESLEQKRIEGWEVTVSIDNITLESMDWGSVDLIISMKNKDQYKNNRITYPIGKNNGMWKINELPFKKLSNGPINLYYLPSLESKADMILADIKELVDLYSQTFGWDPQELNIKLYDTPEKIAASVGWPSLYGVAVPFVSLKFVVEGEYSVTYGLMKHEIVHMMLADLSNDNAPMFLQEGLAIFVSSAVVKNDTETPQLDFTKVKEKEKIIVANTKEIKPISELNEINYTENYIDIYNVGFLITDYLIQTHGIEKYLEMVELLKESDIIEHGNPDRDNIVYQLTVEAIEQIYGSIEKISDAYIEHYKEE
ncbi:hypothetical protein [Sporosarcina cyprini]|uniref:hypothetical protein n=1 Tax=Sporosarcina cyprini TaxID=2910523 RepID=UPI001EE0CD55|nr:hypothetical protein [Sporosarcina cyprini]MCG3088929.1 hypothetical protein [Sporosarcina cyprini]